MEYNIWKKNCKFQVGDIILYNNNHSYSYKILKIEKSVIGRIYYDTYRISDTIGYSFTQDYVENYFISISELRDNKLNKVL